jgi:hypothetical protein
VTSFTTVLIATVPQARLASSGHSMACPIVSLVSIQVHEHLSSNSNNMTTILKLENSRGNQLNPPFKLINWFNADELIISWEIPKEPSCNSSRDCKDWPNSTCNSASDGKKRCLCNRNFRWDGLKLNCSTKG